MKHGILPLRDLQTWSKLNDVQLSGASIEADIVDDDGHNKGGGLMATVDSTAMQPLVAVPLDLVLSKERVEQCAKADQQLREVIDATHALFQSPRTAVLLFIIYQMTINNPINQEHAMRYKNPFADYVKMLPHEILLPIFYTSEEKDLLRGTSLADALEQKLATLDKEYETLQAVTSSVPWCKKFWWDEAADPLTLEDWKLADAMYRSRALELPRGNGLGMVPVVDMANHASDHRYNARFEVEDSESVLLVVRDSKAVQKGDEITIMYGGGGACEMIFSYGFLEEGAISAREMFLDLSIPNDDPLRLAKVRYAKEAPGVRLYVDDRDQVQWESTFVWWACVNEEDGLDFKVEQTLSGDMELKATWNGADLEEETLSSLLHADELRDVFVLRAVVIVQEKIEQKGSELAASQEYFEQCPQNDTVRKTVYQTIGKFRNLEMQLLTRAYDQLEVQKNELLSSEVVQGYLSGNIRDDQASGVLSEDFS